MGHNILDGDAFIFINRMCNCMKILHMECGGLVIYHLRLESGTFNLTVLDEKNHHSYHSSWQKLMLLVQTRNSEATNEIKKQPVFQ
jgi:hypothetical protein